MNFLEKLSSSEKRKEQFNFTVEVDPYVYAVNLVKADTKEPVGVYTLVFAVRNEIDEYLIDFSKDKKNSNGMVITNQGLAAYNLLMKAIVNKVKTLPGVDAITFTGASSSVIAGDSVYLEDVKKRFVDLLKSNGPAAQSFRIIGDDGDELYYRDGFFINKFENEEQVYSLESIFSDNFAGFSPSVQKQFKEKALQILGVPSEVIARATDDELARKKGIQRNILYTRTLDRLGCDYDCSIDNSTVVVYLKPEKRELAHQVVFSVEEEES